ncbi:GNAT family N-acetyltransferase [Pseudomonas sp. UMAB-08]|uniref:GNAT family N-acetyltransferase n=1 Tax=Pseudomonas sp. UMAB-08 TaxID=1365375 RepID=UPI001C5A0211
MTISPTSNVSGSAAFPSVNGEHWIDLLSNGTHILIRPLAPHDRDREFNFIKKLSPESRHFRFLGSMNEPSIALLDQLMDVDNKKRMAYVALAHKDGELIEIGVSRYAALEEEGQCECAVVIADDWQNLGMGTLLMRHLIDAARRNGFAQMVSIDSTSNTHMHQLTKQLGFECHRDPMDATQVIYKLALK